MSVDDEAEELDTDLYEGSEFEPIGPQMEDAEQWAHYTRYFYLLCKLVFFSALIYGVYWVITTLASIVFPLFISLLIAYLLDPVVDKMEARKIPRTVGILICLFAGMLLTFFISLFLYPTLARQIGNVVDRVPQVVELVQTRTIPWVEETFKYPIPPTFTEAIAEYSAEIKDAAPGVLRRIGEWASGLVTQTGAIMVSLLNAIMIPIFTFYFLRDFDKITAAVGDLLPNYRRGFLNERIELMDTVVGEWFRGQLQVAGILAVMYSIGLSIVFAVAGIDVKSGVAIGLVTGLLNVIPYFGVAIGIILSVVVVILEWVGFGPVLGVIGVFVFVQTLEGYYITPKIVGEKVGLSPVTVIIVLLLGGELFGLLGILLAIPIAGAIKVILPDLIDYYKATPFFTGRGVYPAPSRVSISAVDDGELHITTQPTSTSDAAEASSGAVSDTIDEDAESAVSSDEAEKERNGASEAETSQEVSESDRSKTEDDDAREEPSDEDETS